MPCPVEVSSLTLVVVLDLPACSLPVLFHHTVRIVQVFVSLFKTVRLWLKWAKRWGYLFYLSHILTHGQAWRAKCPEFLENGTALFQGAFDIHLVILQLACDSLRLVHDFFAPQPVKQAAIFVLRVVLHDWPDDFARRILLHLREAAMPHTKLLLGDFILPLACPDEVGENELLEGIQGVEAMLAPPPLLPNLGKASANAYWMDMTVRH